MGSRHSVCVILVTALLLAARDPDTGFAQPAPEDPPAPPDAPKGPGNRDDDDRKARQLYLDGEADYAAGRYERAAEKFQRAYELSGRAPLLFNLANAYERMGKYAAAAAYLRRYLDSPRVDDVVSVRERIKRLEATIAANRDAQPRQPDAINGSLAGTAPLNSTSDTRSRALWPMYAAFTAAGVGVVGAVVFGVRSGRAADDVRGLCSYQDGHNVCLQGAGDALDRERRYARLADLSVGIAMVGAGMGLYLMLRTDRRAADARNPTAIAPLAFPGGLGVEVSGAL